MEHPVRNNRSPLRLIIGLMGLLSMTACSTLGMLHTKPQFAYVANWGNVSAYRIHASTGALTDVPGSPFAAGSQPIGVKANRAGTFAFVVSEYSDIGSNHGSISVYRIHASTGTLTPVPGSPFAAGPYPTSVAINPAGTFAYVVTGVPGVGVGSIWAYRIDARSGALTPVPGSPFTTGTLPSSITVNPAGTFAYVANVVSGDVSAYSINAATGALTPVPGSPFAVGERNMNESVTVNPAGTFVYVASVGVNDGNYPHRKDSISAYSINGTTGALTEISGSPFAAGKTPVAITVNPAGTFAYVANQFTGYEGHNGTISAYRINATTGALTEIPGSPFTAGIEPTSIAVDTAGTLAYVTNQGNFGGNGSISAYRIDAATGALKPVAGRPFMTGTRPDSITISQPQ